MCHKFVVGFVTLLMMIAQVTFSQGLKMQVELDNPIKFHYFTNNQSVFISEGEKSSLYDLNNGNKIYELKPEDFEPKGLSTIIDGRYWVSTEKNINCYDILTGKLLWSKGYHDIDQEYYSGIKIYNNMVLLSYGGVILAVDSKTGDELWYQIFKFKTQLPFNFHVLPKQNKIFAFLEDDEIGVYDFATGKQLSVTKDFEISRDVTEKEYSFTFLTEDERYGVFLLDDNVAVVDFVQNKEIGRSEISYDGDFAPILPTGSGCVVLGKKKIIFVNNQNGKITEVPKSVSDFRTYDIMKVGDKDIFLAGLKNSMFAIDLSEGKILWTTKEDDPDFEGYAHHYVKSEGNNLLFTYNNTGWTIGTDLFLMSVDAFTGKLNYKIPVANCRQAIMGFQRFMSDLSSSVNKTQNDFGYDNIGFDYNVFDYNGKIVFAILTPYGMRNPEKRDGAGEGVCIVDSKTGAVLFKDYVRLFEETAAQRKPGSSWWIEPFIDVDNLFLLGDEAIGVWNLSSMKRLWISEKTLKNTALDAAIIENVLYIKFGQLKMSIGLSTEAGGLFSNYGLNVEEAWDWNPYGFIAYDLTFGKVLWATETKQDPGFLSINFSIKNSYDTVFKRSYFADEENIYAFQLRNDGGKYDWTYNLGDNGLGNIPLEKSFAIQEIPIGEISSSYSFYSNTSSSGLLRTDTEELDGIGYQEFEKEKKDAYDWLKFESMGTVWGVLAKKCLGFTLIDKNIFIVAKKGLALIDAANGKTIWTKKWSYDQDNIQYLPKLVGDKVVYCVDRELTCISMNNGGNRFQVKESKRPHFILSLDNKFIISIDEDGEFIKGYEL
jgi:hypothetical protein